MKYFIYGGLLTGSFVGSKIPSLWDASMFSISGFIFSTLFAILGAILGQKIYQYFN